MAFTGLIGTSSSRPGNTVPAYDDKPPLRTRVGVASTFQAPPVVTAGVSVGSSFLGDSPTPISPSVSVGSTFTAIRPPEVGASVGSTFSTPTQYGGAVAVGCSVGTVFTSDSGDLANGRYRG